MCKCKDLSGSEDLPHCTSLSRVVIPATLQKWVRIGWRSRGGGWLSLQAPQVGLWRPIWQFTGLAKSALIPRCQTPQDTFRNLGESVTFGSIREKILGLQCYGWSVYGSTTSAMANCSHAGLPADAATAPMTTEGIPMIKTAPAAAKQVIWAWTEEAAERILW